MGADPEASGSIKASGVQCLIREVDRLRAELAGRRAGEAELGKVRTRADQLRQYTSLRDDPVVVASDHITWQERAIHDLLTDGAALLAQGAAEERARVT